jgi:exosortase B
MQARLDARFPRAVVEWLPVLAGLLALYVPSFISLLGKRWREDDYTYGPIVLGIVVWLVWRQRALLLDARRADPAPAAGFALLGFGLLLYTFGRAQDIALFEMGSVAPVLAGALLALRGWAALRALWFALAFTVFLVPLPRFFVDALSGPLKQGVSAIAEQVLYAAGYPAARSGVVLAIGQYQLLVADACSGLNSMFSLTMVGVLYLYLMRHPRWWHNGVILASLLPIAFGANIVRVLLLVLVTYHFGDAAGQGFLHYFSGLVLFSTALALILALDVALACRSISAR